jgi:hypothetical protein
MAPVAELQRQRNSLWTEQVREGGDGEFSVVEFYDDGFHAYVERWLDAKSAVMLAKRCTDRAMVTGHIAKVVITDGGDNTCFEWQYGKGVTFPGAH